MNFYFKIFGTPHVFDLYQGRENEMGYFRSFYNESKENAKLTIHRMVSGQVSYSYLRYNFLSGSGRTGSFFGMSVVFNGEYCADMEGLYKLFEAVYETILQNRILIEEIKENTLLQAKYLVRTFAEAESEVKRIENIISKNLLSAFAGDIHSIDPSFIQGNPSLIKLNLKKRNAAFVEALREYSWVSISPEYKDKEKNLSPPKIVELDETIVEEQKNITDIAINSVKGMDVQNGIDKSYKQIIGCKNTIIPYLKIQPELKERGEKLNELQEKLDDLKTALANKESEKPPTNGNDDKSAGKNSSFKLTLNGIDWSVDHLLESLQEELKDKKFSKVINNCDAIINWEKTTEEQKVKTEKLKLQAEKLKLQAENSNKGFWKTIKIPPKVKRILRRIVPFAAFIVFVVVCFFVLKIVLSGTDIGNVDRKIGAKCLSLLSEGDSLVNKVDPPIFDKAKEKYGQANSLKAGIADDNIKTMNKAAIEYYKNRAEAEFNVDDEKRDKIKSYYVAIAELDKAKQFDYSDYDNDKNDYGTKTIEFYHEIIATNGNNIYTTRCKKYAEYILQIDSNDLMALEIKNYVLPKPVEEVPATTASPTLTPPVSKAPEKITIHISKVDRNYTNPTTANIDETFRVGQYLVITAKSDNNVATDGTWKLEGDSGIIEFNDLKKNPIRVVLGRAGSVKLTFKNQSCTLKINR
jgi:hypothetical protein